MMVFVRRGKGDFPRGSTFNLREVGAHAFYGADEGGGGGDVDFFWCGGAGSGGGDGGVEEGAFLDFLSWWETGELFVGFGEGG